MDGLPISEKENNPPGQSNENFAQECPAGTIGANSTKILQWQTGSHERSIQNQGMTKACSPKQKSQEQMQLVERFKKLRQWQQQQQENLLRQQRQQLEAVKLGQNKLQGILAVQKLLYEQTGAEQGSPAPKQASRAAGSFGSDPNTEQEAAWQRAVSSLPSNQSALSSGTQNQMNASSSFHAPNRAVESGHAMYSDSVVWQQLGHCAPSELPAPIMNRSAAMPGHLLIEKTSVALGEAGYPRPQLSTNLQPSLGVPDLGGMSPAAPGVATGATQGGINPFVPMATPFVSMATNLVPMPTTVPEGYRGSPSGSSQPYDLESQDDDLSELEVMSGVYPLNDGSCSEAEDREDGERAVVLVEESGNARGLDVLAEDGHFLADQSNLTVIEEMPSPGEDKGNASAHMEQELGDEERPIGTGVGTGKKTFEDLLEEQLKKEEMTTVTISPEKPRKTFLRKGQGLARFKGKNAAQKATTKRSGKQQPRGKELSPNDLAAPGKGKLAGSSKVLARVDTGLMPPQNKLTRKLAGKSAPSTSSAVVTSRTSSVAMTSSAAPADQQQATITRKSMQPTPGFDPLSQCRSRGVGLSPRIAKIDCSFQARLQEMDKVKEIEDEDLEEFEMLEQAAAANASFSSTSSVVVKVLEKARGRNQTQGILHQDRPGQTCQTEAGGILSPVDTGYGSSEGRATQAADSASAASLNADDEDSEADITLVETRGTLPGRVGEEEAATSHRANQTHKAVIDSSPSEDFGDEESWDDMRRESDAESSDGSDVTISDVFPVVSSTPPPSVKPRGEEKAMASTPPTSALVSKLFPQLKPKAKESSDQTATPMEKLVDPLLKTSKLDGNKPITRESMQSAALRERLQELDSEIERFREENAKLERLRLEREEGLKRLQDEITTFENQKAQELERLQKFKEEELQKLRKEKRVFEKYCKASRAVPDKKERGEIEGLRNQITELQEELKRRESRWSAASARYRNRVECLETRNQELQEEVKVLEQYRLQTRQKQDASNTRDAQDARRIAQRKNALNSTEDDVGGKPAPTHPPAPRGNTARAPAVAKPVQDETFSPTARDFMNEADTNNNQPVASELPPAVHDKRPVRSPREEHILSRSIPSAGESSRKTRSSPQEKQPKRLSLSPDDVRTHSPENGLGLPSTEWPGTQDSREIVHPDGKVERIKSDGSRVISFSNGTRKEISSDGKTLTVTFFNGDIKQIFPDQRVTYYYADAQTTHTTYADGLEVLQFPNNQIEKHYPDKTKEIIFPDQTIKYLHPQGTEECVFADGTIQRMGADGERTIEFPNGQREVHTKHFKKREYPDGTIKTVFPDGRTETRYATGRLRLKDREGRVLIDTADPTSR